MLRLAILALVSRAAIADASPRTDPTLGRAVFTGATSPSATSISLNPAALRLGKAGEVYVALVGLLEQFGVDRRLIDPVANEFVDGPNVSDVQVGAGAMIGWVLHPGERGSLGLQLRIPPPELFPNDPALRYHSLGSRQTNYIATFATSLRISNRFFVGVSVSHDVTRLRLRYARDTALDAGLDADCGGASCGLENPLASELYDVRVRSKYVSSDNLHVTVGLLVKIAKEIYFGLAYHNSPGFGIQSRLSGSMDVTHAERDGGVRLGGDSTVYVSYPASADGEFRARIFPRLDLHVGGRWEDLSRMQAYDVRGYGSAFRDENIPEWTLRPRGFRDAFAFWAGVQQVETDSGSRWRFGGRIGIETSANPPHRTAPGSASPTSLTLDGGAALRIAPNWVMQLSYGLQLFQRVSADASQYDPRFAIECADRGFDYTTLACGALREGYAIPTAAGDYSRLQHAVRLGLSYEIP